jgi:hypothetical protein
MRKLHLLLLLIFIGTKSYSQNLGLILKGSTTGVGIDLGYRINTKWLVKMGTDSYSYKFLTNYQSSDYDMNLDANILVGSGSLVVDYQIFKRVYLSGGAILNNFNTKVDGTLQSDIKFGDVILSKSKLGNISWEVEKYKSVAPYLGIGFGNNMNSRKKVNLSLEIGGMFQEAPQLKIISNGVFQTNSDVDINQAGSLSESIEQYKIYPVFKLNFGIKLASFVKKIKPLVSPSAIPATTIK